MNFFLKTFLLGLVGAAGSALGRRSVNKVLDGSSRQKIRWKPINKFYTPYTYDKTEVACPACSGVFYLGRDNDRPVVETVRAENPECIPLSKADVGERFSVERRGRNDRRDLLRSQTPSKS